MVFLKTRPERSSLTLLEYIESSGTQYIDTGFKPNQDTRVVVDIQVLASQTAEGHICSVADDRYYTLFFAPTGGWYKTRFGDGGVLSFPNSFNNRQRKVIDKNKNVTSIGDTSVTAVFSSFQLSNTLPIFCRKRNGSVEFLLRARLFSFKIYDNGVIVRDYHPAKDPNDVVCLYDGASNEYVYNSGTGVFFAGPEL